MASFNKVIIMGNLTRDPELRHTPAGTAVTELGVAVNNKTGKGADAKDDTVFVDVTAWDKVAETCAEYLVKGRPVLVEGRLKLDSWEDKESGKKRSKLAVVASSVTFLGSKDQAEKPAEKPVEKEEKPEAPDADPFEGADENVPF